MAKTGLAGPHPLTFDAVTDMIVRRSPGAYALGYIDPDGRFRINHVGSCARDIKEKLCNLIGSAAYFKFGYFPTSEAAFERECELFHDFNPPGNRIHPGRPAGSRFDCPRCRIFD